MTPLSTLLEAAQWALLLLILLGVLGLGSQVGRLRLAMAAGGGGGPMIPNDGLDIGARSPDLKGEDSRTGQSVTLSSYPGRPVLIVFLSTSCAPCSALAPHLNQLADQRSDIGIVAVILTNPNQERWNDKDLSESVAVVRDDGKTLERAFEVRRTPLAYLIDVERRVANRTVPNTLNDLEATVAGHGRSQGEAVWVART